MSDICTLVWEDHDGGQALYGQSGNLLMEAYGEALDLGDVAEEWGCSVARIRRASGDHDALWRCSPNDGYWPTDDCEMQWPQTISEDWLQ